MRIAATLWLALLAGLAVAAGTEYRLVIENHRFEPAELYLPADTKVRLLVENRDATPEEFESYELNREKIIRGNTTATIWVGPLKPGRYPFFGEFHMATAQGVIVVEE